MGQIVFIVWREAAEALLVIGVLDAWLRHSADPAERRIGRGMLWCGVAAGLAAAGALGWALMFASGAFGEDTQEILQIVIVLTAATLIVQTVAWSRRKSGGRRTLEGRMQLAGSGARWPAVFVLATLAVAREGAETFVFLWGSLASARAEIVPVATGIGLGLAAALATYLVIQAGSRILSWRIFFRVSEVALLLLAGALLVTGIDRLAGLDLIPIGSPLWDTSGFLDDSSTLGSIVSSLTGYRARPDAVQLGVMVAYWVAAWVLFGRPSPNVGRSVERV